MIKIKIIFNTLLIILLVYFIIQFIIPYCNVEKFENKNDDNEEEEQTDMEEEEEISTNKRKKNKKVRFAKKIKIYKKADEHKEENKDEESEEEAEENIKSENEVKENFENKNIEPANFYTSDNNTPNFVSNVEDLRKFYQYNSFDGLEKTPKTPTKQQEFHMNQNQQILDAVSKQPAYLQKGSNGQTLTNEYWQYNNELPMCGGTFGGINGFDTLNNGYAIYEVSKENSKPLLNDDLRNGMGIPQKEEYKYNMSMP